MDILIVTDQVDAWSAFEKVVTDAKHVVQFVATKSEATTICQSKRFGALIWDSVTDALSHRDTVIEFLMIDASMHQCVVTAIDADQFHEDTEGLGLLPVLGFDRDPYAFLNSIKQVEATFSFAR